MVERISVAEIFELQKKIRESVTLPNKCTDEWHKSEFDPMSVLVHLKHIRLEDGVRLLAYHNGASMGNSSVVYAVPETGNYPDPSDLPKDDRQRPKLDTPYETVMHAIKGDGSAFSYLEASILYREVDELGHTWHETNWKMHKVIDQDPTSQSKMKIAGEHEIPVLWTWKEQKPKDWSPSIEVAKLDGLVARVTFYTFQKIEGHGVVRWTDRYSGISYVPSTEREDIVRSNIVSFH